MDAGGEGNPKLGQPDAIPLGPQLRRSEASLLRRRRRRDSIALPITGISRATSNFLRVSSAEASMILLVTDTCTFFNLFQWRPYV